MITSVKILLIALMYALATALVAISILLGGIIIWLVWDLLLPLLT